MPPSRRPRASCQPGSPAAPCLLPAASLIPAMPLAGPGLHQGLSRALDFGAVHNAEVARQPKSFFLSPCLLYTSPSPRD